MIEINQPIILANRQIIKFDSIEISRRKAVPLYNEGLTAILKFEVCDENGKHIEMKTFIYRGNDFNEFWNSFNTGTFLYEELKRNANLDIIVSDSEAEFLNN